MSTDNHPILRIPETVREDTLAYRGRVDKFLAGTTNPVAFRAQRVPMGIYEQRTAGTYMVRIRIGAGLVTSNQLRHIAELTRQYAEPSVHITTRQDIQIHSVKIEETPDILESLLGAGLSPRGGGGNTVRNVTACGMAGVCPHEKFDVAPHAVAVAEYLLRARSSFNLPRKYKIVFSGCSRDCAFASVADLGFFAHMQNGQKGFAVYAAGGLGPNAAVGVKVEDFVGEDEIFEVAETVKRLFDKHGDRLNKHKARLRYVLKRLGVEEFRRLYRSEREAVANEGLGGDLPELVDINGRFAGSEAAESVAVAGHPDVIAEKTEGRYTVRIRLPLGDISADDVERIAELSDEYACGLVRTTQLQNLLITSVPGGNVEMLRSELAGLKSFAASQSVADIVACTGASTCKLGLCLSRGLAKAVGEKLSQSGVDDVDTTIRISGCPNSCGHHCISKVGFQGRARRINERLLPCYDVLIDAETIEGDARLGEVVGTLPAHEIPDALVEAASCGKIDTNKLADIVRSRGDFTSEELPDHYFYDFDSDEPFSLAGRGPGECGAGVMDVIKVDIDEASEAMAAALNADGDPQISDEIYKASIAAARSLLVIFGLEPHKDREILAAFGNRILGPGWVKPHTQELLNALLDYRLGDVDSIADRASAAVELVERITELFGSLDAALKFTVEPYTPEGLPAGPAMAETALKIDLRGVGCPLNFVKAKLELEKIEIGQMLEVLLDDGDPVRNVPASFADQGQEIIEIENHHTYHSLRVRRCK